MDKRRHINREKILERDGYICGYCFERRATEVDHILPVSYRQINTDDNLIACCRDCNAIASDHVFDGLEEKRAYIQEQLKTRRWAKRRLLQEVDFFVPPSKIKIYRKIEPRPKVKKVRPEPVHQSPVVAPIKQKTRNVIQVGELEFIATVTAQNLRELREELGLSLAEFGQALKRAVHPDDPLPYSRQYVNRLEHGRNRVTPEIQSAFYVLAGRMDGLPAGIGGAVRVEVLALPGQIEPGAYIPANYVSIRCGYPGCPVVFVKPAWSKQLYHAHDCRARMNDLRRQTRRKPGGPDVPHQPGR